VRYNRASGNRALGYAIAASIVLHGLLLGADWPQLADALKQPVEALAPIVARLVAPAPPPPPAPAPPPAPRPAPRQVEEKPSLPKPATKPKPVPQAGKPVEAPQPAPAPAPSAPPSSPVAKAAPSASPVPAPPAVAVPDTASLIERYRAALLAEARRHKAYPTAAVDNGWEGEVVVRMAIGPDGSIAALEVRSSSGYPLLDRQAVEMFRRAKPHVALPEALLGKPFAVELRAVFNLKDQASG
jgi:periplasmic protein TonB